MAEILDIEKISEIGKLDIQNLKLILRELLNDIKAEEKQNQEFKVDISVILKLLYEKGFITKEEYEDLKNKINSLIESDKIDDAYDDDVSDEVIEDIIKKSKFKGFFKSYNELINKLPASKATHGDYAYIKDFDADSYDVNNIEEFIFDINYKKWMSATDTTHLRNVYIRDDETDRYGKPLNNDLLQYNEAIKRWVCRTFDEADIARKSVVDFHIGNQLYLEKDEVGIEDGSVKDNGRLIVKLDTSVPNKEPLHINKETFKKLLEEIDNDYYTKLEIETEVDEETGIEKIKILGDDIDEYGNAIRRNVTNEVIRSILENIYNKLLSTFDIKTDPKTKRLIKIDEDEPAKYVPHGINTYNVDKIINAIDKDYNNAFKLSDKEEENYVEILKRVLKGYNELNITDDNVQPIIERLTKLYSEKTLWDRYTKIVSYEKNKNVTPEVFNELIDLIHYLYISKDLIRDEILERDITINGNRTYTNNVKYIGSDKRFFAEFSNFELTNELGTFLVKNGLIKIDNDWGVFDTNNKLFRISNEESTTEINSKKVIIKNQNGKVDVIPDTKFHNNVVIKGDLTVQGTTTEVNATDLNISDNIIILNKGETGNGISKRNSGFQIDRGKEKDFFFGYDDSKDRLIAGEVEAEGKVDNLDYVAMIPNKELDIKKPIVYNHETKLLENSSLIKTDIDGATTFLVEMEEHNFKVLDPVFFKDDILTLCSMDSYENCEIIGIVGEVNGNIIKVVVNGFLSAKWNIPTGTLIYLLDGSIGPKSEHLILQRKVGIKVPNGMIVDIQKNSGNESTEVIREQKMYRLLEANTTIVVPDSDIQLDKKAKVFIDGILQMEGLNYEIDYESNFIRILTPYSYKVDLLIIINLEWASDIHDYVTNEDIDEIFNHGIEPRPPFEDTEYMQNYEVDRMFGIITSEPPGPPVDPNDAEWCTNEEVDNIFSARALYSKYNLLEQIITKDIFVDGTMIYYFSDNNNLTICDFVEIDDNGKFNKINYNTQNLVGIVQKVIEYENGLFEYQINTNKVIPYTDIPLNNYIDKYKVNIEFGDKLYIKNNINKFAGNPICKFSNLAVFIEYQKVNNNSINKPNIEKDNNIINLYQDKYYSIKTNSMSINTLDLFEKDSPNFCKLNLINNSVINEKNLFADIQLGIRLVEIYRYNDLFVIKPIRDILCNSKIEFKEINYNSNFIKII